MHRVLCSWFTPAVLGVALMGLSALGLSGCGSEQRETGTTVEVTDQMLKDVEASDAYYMEQEKKQSNRD